MVEFRKKIADKMLYPRESARFPDIYSAIYPNRTPPLDHDPPAAIEIHIPSQQAEYLGIYISLVTLAARGYGKACAEMQAAMHAYLTVDGSFSNLLQECSKYIDIVVKSDEKTTSETKRGSTNRTGSFERRLEIHDCAIPCNRNTVAKVREILVAMECPHNADAAGPLNEFGRRVRTNAKMLAAAIKRLEVADDRSECNAHFESLAAQLWDWRYPKLDNETRAKLLSDFNQQQATLFHATQCSKGCSNATVRMLWHFDLNGIPYDINMFRLPDGEESWVKNIAALGMLGTWDPRKTPRFAQQ